MNRFLLKIQKQVINPTFGSEPPDRFQFSESVLGSGIKAPIVSHTGMPLPRMQSLSMTPCSGPGFNGRFTLVIACTSLITLWNNSFSSFCLRSRIAIFSLNFRGAFWDIIQVVELSLYIYFLIFTINNRFSACTKFRWRDKGKSVFLNNMLDSLDYS